MPPRPLPEPASASDQLASDASLAELRLVDLDDLLALCERYAASPPRLARYLAVLRARFGARAQFAAALVCFDLARGGSPSAQREFQALVPSLLAVRLDDEPRLIGDNPYLESRWADCREALSRADPRDLGVADFEYDPVGNLELLSADERAALPPPPPPPESDSARQGRVQLGKLLDAQLGIGPQSALRIGAAATGFDTSSGAALERFEYFLSEVEKLAPELETARGLRGVGKLFFATHLRRHSWFGRPNLRRARNVREGLLAFARQPEPPVAAASVFDFAGQGVVERFQKVSELLLDYIDFCARVQVDPLSREAARSYVAADRQPPVLFIEGARRRR